mmetsp:Transcript_4827/g.5586  ORF Transcript_4827/g.5586 Transcript_4827/m.5586 type:complete len:327 (-) Transcript_4827:109-1089(-)|eukprot:CAMPEP_0184015992 /NCGR_PEP_ID=MMETSP0954-20121128/6666_1 /TAXON_ID=627963 /ORGANISM="Aplanochytrium sp, Strain PBS07" /LENGTH=326 /DNA_ID=CAMNT_0026296933 /DNA_START=534 /DNA_END=1514 /DNA_ORIENTATION=-
MGNQSAKRVTALSPEKMEFHRRFSLSPEVLGKGRFGEVRLATDRKGKEYAVKTIEKCRIEDEEDMEEIHNEIFALESLDHKNIVKLYGSFDDGKTIKMVLGTSKKGDLFDFVTKATKITETDCKNIAKKLASALKYCLDQGVVHRDLKPENILVGNSPTFDDLAIIDFGYAKKISKERVRQARLRTKCGTMSFVAPEVLNNDSYNYKSDIWSLGVLLFVVASGGFHPFIDEDEEQTRLKVERAVWRFDPEERWFGVSSQAKDFIQNCMNTSVDKRYTYEQLLEHEWIAQRKSSWKRSLSVRREKVVDFSSFPTKFDEPTHANAIVI